MITMLGRARGVIAEARRGGDSLATAIVKIYGFQLVAAVVGLVTAIIVARVLGPAGQGRVALFTVLVQTLTEFGTFGFGAGLIYHVANRRRAMGEAHGTALAAALIAGVAIAAAGTLGLGLWRGLFPGLDDWALILGVAIAPLLIYRTLWANLAVAFNRAVMVYRFAAATALVMLLAVIGLAAVHRLGAAEAIAVTAATTCGAAVVGAFRLQRIHGGRAAISRSLAVSSYRYGLIVYAGLLANLLHFRVDQLMVGHLLGTRSVGIYAVSVRLAETLFLLDTGVTAASTHRIASTSGAEGAVLAQKLVRAQLAVSGAGALALAALAYPVIRLFFGSAYLDAVVPLVLLMPGIVAWSLARLLSGYISFNRGRQRWPAVFAGGGLVLNIGLNLVMIPHWGLVGAAFASAISYSSVLVLTWLTFASLQRRAAQA